MRLFDNLYRFVDGVTVWSSATFNAVWRSIDDRLHTLEDRAQTFDEVSSNIVAETRASVQEIFDPAVQTIRRMQDRGFLIASSSTAQAIVEGNALALTIDDEDARDLFTPTTFTILTRSSDVASYGVLRTIEYDRLTGRYRFEVVTWSGDGEPHEDWVIGALAGPTLAQIDYLHAGVAARDRAIEAQAAIDAIAGDLAALVDQLTDGPVATVNGVSGPAAVILAADIKVVPGRSETIKDELDRLAIGKASRSSVESKADAANVYSRSEADTRFLAANGDLDGGTF